MREIEKLRALLAEAVPLNTPCPSCLRTIEEERRGYGREGCTDTARRLLIDAALAEPVVKELDVAELEDAALDAEDGRRRAEVSLAEALSSARSWEVHTHAANLRAERAEKERNEARAEVERLKKAMEDRWFECHDGSEQACCKSHE